MKHIVTLAIALAAAVPASAANLLVNGDFESGAALDGWNQSALGGSSGNILVETYDGVSPISGFSYQNNASGGRFFVITDQTGPGSYALVQSFNLAAATKVVISFDLFANSNAPVINNGRQYTAGPNQNAVVSLLTGTPSGFTDNAADIVATLYGPGADAGPNPNPWASYSTTLMLAAGTYTFRFAEADNQSFFQAGIDNVSVSAVPESATWALMIVGFGLVGVSMRHRKAAIAA